MSFFLFFSDCTKFFKSLCLTICFVLSIFTLPYIAKLYFDWQDGEFSECNILQSSCYILFGRKSMKKQLLHLLKWRREQLWQNLCWRLHCSISLAKLKLNHLHGVFLLKYLILYCMCALVWFWSFGFNLSFHNFASKLRFGHIINIFLLRKCYRYGKRKWALLLYIFSAKSLLWMSLTLYLLAL